MPGPTLTLRQLNRATLARQGLLEPLGRASVARLLERLGPLQAQHPDWPPLALETRRPTGWTPVDLERARARRHVVRAPLMRMTVHLASAADYWPMATLTHPFRETQWRILFKGELRTSPLGRRIGRGHDAVLAAMADRPLAIHEIEAILAAHMGSGPIPANRPLWRHFSASIPLVLVPFPEEGYGRARYLPAEQWLGSPSADEADPDRAADAVLTRYLGAFGPASVEDLTAWVGRGRDMARWRQAFRRAEDRLVAFVDEQGRTLYDLPTAPRPDADAAAPPRLLARWDSLLLAYGTAHRTRVLPEAHQATVITRNADVLPTFLVDGMVAGTWLPKRNGGDGLRLKLRPFGRLAAADREALEAEADRLLGVLGRGAFSRYPGTD